MPSRQATKLPEEISGVKFQPAFEKGEKKRRRSRPVFSFRRFIYPAESLHPGPPVDRSATSGTCKWPPCFPALAGRSAAASPPAPEKRSMKTDTGSRQIPHADCPRRRSRKPGRLHRAPPLVGLVLRVQGVQPFSVWPHVVSGPMLLILAVHSDDSIFPTKNSCDPYYRAAKTFPKKLNSPFFTTNLYFRAS